MLSVAILGGIYFFLLDYVTLKIILFICFAASIILLVDLVAIFLKKKKKNHLETFLNSKDQIRKLCIFQRLKYVLVQKIIMNIKGIDIKRSHQLSAIGHFQ
jgi:hypothetical protein